LCGVLDNSVGVAQAAERRGVWLIGHNTDLSSFAPTRCLSGTRWIWGRLYSTEVNAMLANTWRGGTDASGGLKEGFVGITNFLPAVPRTVQDEVERVRNLIISGERSVYAGPIRDNTGAVRVPAGQTLTHPQIMAIDWQVEGLK